MFLFFSIVLSIAAIIVFSVLFVVDKHRFFRALAVVGIVLGVMFCIICCRELGLGLPIAQSTVGRYLNVGTTYQTVIAEKAEGGYLSQVKAPDGTTYVLLTDKAPPPRFVYGSDSRFIAIGH